MKNKKQLIKKLDNISTKVAVKLVDAATPVNRKDGGVWVGQITVIKNKFGLFNVVSLNKEILYENIANISIATIIAEKYNKKEANSLRQIIELENTYSKNFLDALHYTHSIQAAILRKDFNKVDIIRNRLDLTNARIKNLKASMLKFKST